MNNLRLKEDVRTMEDNKSVLDVKRGKRVRELREYRKYSQDQLADLINVSQGAIQRIENGGGTRHWVELAKVLECDVGWLKNGEGPSPYLRNLTILKPLYELPMLSWLDAIRWQSCIEVADNQEKILMEEKYKNCFGLIIKDDLMVSQNLAESFNPGEKIIVNPHIKPEHNKFVVAHQKGAPEAFLRKYVISGNDAYLMANKGLLPILVDDEISILGVVVKVVLEREV